MIGATCATADRLNSARTLTRSAILYAIPHLDIHLSAAPRRRVEEKCLRRGKSQFRETELRDGEKLIRSHRDGWHHVGRTGRRANGERDSVARGFAHRYAQDQRTSRQCRDGRVCRHARRQDALHRATASSAWNALGALWSSRSNWTRRPYPFGRIRRPGGRGIVRKLKVVSHLHLLRARATGTASPAHTPSTRALS